MKKAVSSLQAGMRNLRGQAARSRTIAVVVCVLLCGVGWARTREKAAPSFTIVVEEPYSRVVAVVEEVARGSMIRGTFEYAGDEQLEGAEFAAETRLFPTWTGGGKVFYKLRGRTLAPKHFLDSNDVGTVAVRYVVQEAGTNATRLVIDAVFAENGRHHQHPSDGYVETCEFAEIGQRLKEFERQRSQRASGQEYSSSQESSLPPAKRTAETRVAASATAERTTEKAVDARATGDIGRAIAEQQAQLAAETAQLHELEAQVRQMRAAEFERIGVERAELKASPYAHARVLAALKQGQEVTVLDRSSYWCRVRSEDGQEGWISHTALEVRP